jgi:hypothetical protein
MRAAYRPAWLIPVRHGIREHCAEHGNPALSLARAGEHLLRRIRTDAAATA